MQNLLLRKDYTLLVICTSIPNQTKKNRIYWDCRLIRAKECNARVITNFVRLGTDVMVTVHFPESSFRNVHFIVFKGHRKSVHQHLPYSDKVAAKIITTGYVYTSVCTG